MVDENEEFRLEKGVNSPKGAKSAPFVWKSLPVTDLIRYYDEIREVLPPLSLDKMNLEEEMLLQFHTMRALQHEVLNDHDFPLNQRVQAANSVASALAKLSERQSEVYTQERHKAIEALLIRHLNKLPEDVAEAFLKDYAKVLANL